MSEQKAVSDVDHIDFDDNRLVAELSGGHDAHLAILEEGFRVQIDPRGNRFAVRGAAGDRDMAIAALQALYARLKSGEPVGPEEVRALMRGADIASEPARPSTQLPAQSRNPKVIKTPRRTISPRTPRQGDYLEALASHNLVFGVGPAGTGKTYLAVAHAVSLFLHGAVKRIVLTRPAIEAGERIGFLPGDMKDKVDPYLQPLYDALHDMLHADFVARRIAARDFEIAPIAFMRGRTFDHCAVILDEGQNATTAQMKMFLTRLGEGAHMTINGD
ncbi:MAG: PhoH family protein, partial [Pseudomonadota bacterium]